MLNYIHKNADRLKRINVNGFNVFYEQHLFYALSREEGLPVKVLIEDVIEDRGYKNLADFHDVPFNRCYLHLLGDFKRDEFTCHQMAAKLRELFPDYYERIISLFHDKNILLNPSGFLNVSYRFADTSDLKNRIVVRCLETEIIASSFNWAGIFNKTYQSGAKYYANMQIKKGRFHNLIVFEATDNGFSLYNIRLPLLPLVSEGYIESVCNAHPKLICRQDMLAVQTEGLQQRIRIESGQTVRFNQPERNRVRLFHGKRSAAPIIPRLASIHRPTKHPNAPLHLLERMVSSRQSQTMVRIMPHSLSPTMDHLCRKFTIRLHSKL